MNHPPTLKQLRYLSAVATHQHFGKAASACFVSQSTLSAGILELEAKLGITLLERNNRSVRLTPVGEDINERGKLILAASDDLVMAARAGSVPFSTEMRMGVIPTIAPFVLPRILKSVRKAYPEFKLYIRENLSDDLLTGLHAGKLDVLLLALPYPAKDVTVKSLFHDRLVLAYEKRNSISELNTLRFRDLKGKNLLLLEDGHCLRDHSIGACKVNADQVNLPFQGTSLNTIVQMVANDIGISILPKMAVDAKILKGTTVQTRDFDEVGVQRSIGLMWRKNSPRQQEFEALGSLICKTLNK